MAPHRTPQSKPMLPLAYVREVESNPLMRDYSSSVHTLETHIFRLEMRNWHSPSSPDCYYIIQDANNLGFTHEAKRTRLHYAAIKGDVLGASELLYAGATVNNLDTGGISPLYLLMTHMAEIKTSRVQIVSSGSLGTKFVLARGSWVARLLIEQHADVNISIDNVPLLHLACKAQDWETIALLLKHGASSLPSPVRCFKTPADKSRFEALVESTGRFDSRPPRPCPCYSGKLLSECHEKEPQPYPAHYVCICGSGKKYKVCCDTARGKSRVFEYWDPDLGYISHQHNIIADMAPKVQETMCSVGALKKVGSGLAMAAEAPKDVTKEYMEDIANQGLAQGGMDPAFAYALKKAGFKPRPQGRKMTRARLEAMQRLWNSLVDEYISEGTDARPRQEIERAAKIGPGNGALIRVCEAADCNKVEKIDVDILKKCSKCKISVYCSTECQASAWKDHKKVCCADNQREQCLPSQTWASQYAKGKLEREALYALLQVSVAQLREAGL